MAELVQELNALDFSVYIGGPLQAAVKAQHEASMSQAEFINEVGFVGDGANRALRYVDFSFKKSMPNDAGTDFVDQEVTIKVPFLTMLTIPALRIDEVVIDFNAKLTSTETRNTSSEFNASTSFGLDYKIVNFKASASYRRTTSRGSQVDKTYNLGVKVTALNDEIPVGLDRILTMLEDNIASVQPAAADPAPN